MVFRYPQERSVDQPGLDNRHRNRDGEISHKHGSTRIRTLRKIYGQSFAAGLGDDRTLREALDELDDRSLHQLVHDHEGGHLAHKISTNE